MQPGRVLPNTHTLDPIPEPSGVDWIEIRCHCCERPHLLYRVSSTYIEVWCRQGKTYYFFDFSPLINNPS